MREPTLSENSLLPIPTSDVLDRREQAPVCSQSMHLLGRRGIISGAIRTIRCLEDNALVKSTLSSPSLGEVLVVDAGGSLRTAMLGDQIAGSAFANGWAGVIVFGAVRDSAALAELDFHVKFLGLTPRKSAKQGSGETGVVLHCGGIDFVPGHFLYSDSDGIVVLPEPLP